MNGLTPPMRNAMVEAAGAARLVFQRRHPRLASDLFNTFAASLFVDLVTRSPIYGQDALVAAANRALVEAGSPYRIAERVEGRVQ